MRGCIREKIDSITQIEPKQITRDNLRLHYGTGQEIVTKNSQGNKTSQYRSGVQTNLGDIEQSVWMELVQILIEQENDQEIFEQLLEWEKDNNHIEARTKNDFLREAMQSYTYRIYDNKAWWDYVRFNIKYRPEILKTILTLCMFDLLAVTEQAGFQKSRYVITTRNRIQYLARTVTKEQYFG